GINGFGRIGRQVLKAILDFHANDLEVVAFNDLDTPETMAHLLKYDSNYGHFPGTVEVVADGLKVNGHLMRGFAEKDPSKLPWGDLGVDIVIESTGRFTEREKSQVHLDAGAKKVIISAPAKGEDITIVIGVNEKKYDPAKHHIVSNASCTTNCLAPAVKVVHDNFVVQRALMTTIHAYTNDQRILDMPHKDLRRARAAGLSMIPTTTGAAKAISLVIPDLKGKFDGLSVRIPTPTVSLVDFVGNVEKEVTTEQLHEAFKKAAEGELKGILGLSEEPLVSVDYKGDSRSSIVDKQFTMAFQGTMIKVMAWYDNEWGYSVRTADLAKLMAEKL
ncbi:MAG TPA: type I glyceraldehyde-3-phosphate dehydrogenase, partial [Aggregatilineales bacterium]|nr:type I glyceraldehyde-3-phosphate dehydrogenase [Aggregatilineales bacterium]